MDPDVDIALGEFVERLGDVGAVDAVWVGGSLATGDYVPAVSDLDLVAVTSRALTGADLALVTQIHQELDAGLAHGMDLGCQYADVTRLHDVLIAHPTWTHGELVDRSVSGVTRAELVTHGFSVLGPAPSELLPSVTAVDVRAAALAELVGYWSDAATRPQMFLRLPVMVDLGLTSMARCRHAWATGELLTKSAAIEHVRAPSWLRDQLRDRRRGEHVSSPRLRAGFIAWRDVRRTSSAIRRA